MVGALVPRGEQGYGVIIMDNSVGIAEAGSVVRIMIRLGGDAISLPSEGSERDSTSIGIGDRDVNVRSIRFVTNVGFETASVKVA
jgi:hypothetical protein